MTRSADQQTLPIGAMIDEFRIRRVLGVGNFGIVYECENIHLDETVAIKEFLPTELARRGPDGRIEPLSPATAEAFRWARDRFLQEARTLWNLAHPVPHRNIVRVTRYREANGSAYMFMEFEHGQPLADLLERQGTLTYEELRPLLAPLLDGLERVHAANVLHRDIKPANILIRPDGSPVLIDFGAARNVALSGETSVFATYTPRYAAMEQHYPSGQQGPWTDIYGLGATLYRAVTGQLPKNASERLLGQIQEPASELGRGRYPEHFLAGIDAACALKPEERPPSVAAWRRLLLGEDLAMAVTTLVLPREPSSPATCAAPQVLTPVTTTRSTAPGISGTVIDRAGENRRRRSWRWIASFLAIVALMGVGVWVWLERSGDRLPGSESISHAEQAGRESPPVAAEDDHPKPPSSEPPATSGPGTERAPAVLSAPPDVAATPPETAVPLPSPIRPGERFADPLHSGGVGPTMVGIPAGDFRMGSPPDEADRTSDEQLHLARLPEVFAVSQTEITNQQFATFVRVSKYRTQVDRESSCLRLDDQGVQFVADLSLSWEKPGYAVSDFHPVTCVSWNDARQYAAWLSQETGREYRLPTELEWEYAARANTASSRYWGDAPDQACAHANVADATVRTEGERRARIEGATSACQDRYVYSSPVGVFTANPFGLHDMLGNLAEWTCSDYDRDYRGGEARCVASEGDQDTTPKVIRGGSWLTAPALVRSAARDAFAPNLGLNTLGFRVIATDRPWSQ